MNRMKEYLNESMSRSAADLMRENESLKFTLRQNAKEFEEQQAALRANLNELFNNNEEMMIKEEQYKATIDMLTAKLDVNKEREVDDLERDNSAVLKRLQEKEAALFEAHQEKDSLTTQVSTLTSTLQEKELTLKKLQSEVESCKEEVRLTGEDREIIIMKIAEKDLTIDNLKDKLARTQAQAKRDKANYTKESLALKSQITGLSSVNETMNDDRAQREDSIRGLEEKVRELTDVVNVKDTQIEALKATIGEQAEAVEKTEEVRGRGLADIARLQRELTELKSSMTTLKQNKEVLEEQLQEANNEHSNAVSEHKNELQKLQQEHNEFILQLQEKLSQRADELEASQAEVEELKQSMEETKKEVEEKQAALEEKEKEVEEATSKFNQLQTEYDTCLQDAEEKSVQEQSKSEELLQQIETLEKQTEELKTKLEESSAGKKAIERKQSRMLKDLQAQLAKERAKSKSSLSLDTPSPRGSRARPTAVSAQHNHLSSPKLSSPRRRGGGGGGGSMISTPNHTSSSSSPSSPSSTSSSSITPMSTPTRSSSAVSLTTPTSTPRSSSTPSPQVSKKLAILKNDNDVLATRLGELKERNTHLQEKIKFLHESVQLLHQDLDKKSTIITHYIIARMKREGRITYDMEVHKLKLDGIMAKMYKTAEARRVTLEAAGQQQRVHSQMQIVLQETILKNIQLQNDIETLGNEIKALMEENGNLKNKMKKLIDEM